MRKRSPSPLTIGVIILFILLTVGGFLVGPIGKKVLPGISLPEWLSVPQPEPSLPAEIVAQIGQPIAGTGWLYQVLSWFWPINITNTIIGAWITGLVLVIGAFVITRNMKIVPGRLQAAFEFGLGWIYDLCASVAGQNGRRYFPIVCSLFLFVLFNAWLSLIPGYGSITVLNPEGEHIALLRGANTDLNVPLALACFSFISVAYFGFRKFKLSYLKQFFNISPLAKTITDISHGHFNFVDIISGFVAIFVGLLEFLSQLIRIVSLTFRLFGNMTAGEILLLLVSFLLPWVAAIPFYGLELLVGFVQALIFGGLTLVFLTMAEAEHGEHTAHSDLAEHSH